MTTFRFCSFLLLATGLPLMAGEFPADASGWPAVTAKGDKLVSAETFTWLKEQEKLPLFTVHNQDKGL